MVDIFKDGVDLPATLSEHADSHHPEVSLNGCPCSHLFFVFQNLERPASTYPEIGPSRHLSAAIH